MSKYIEFKECPREPDRKTSTWDVHAVQGGHFLGRVGFWGGWRRFVFVPSQETMFDADCLREIADFCAQATTTWQEKSR